MSVLEKLAALAPKAEKAPMVKRSSNGTNGKGDYRTLDIVRWFTTHGNYGKQLDDPGKHAVLCPWHSEHSDNRGATASDTVIWEGDGSNWPTFHCSHAHCIGHRDIKAVMSLWGDADQFCEREFESPTWPAGNVKPRTVEVRHTATVPTDTPATSEPPPTTVEYEENDKGNGERLVERHGGDLHFSPERGWFVYSGDHWAFDQMEPMRRAKDTQRQIYADAATLEDKEAKQRAKWAIESGDMRRLQAMLLSAQSEPGIAVPLVRWDAEPLLLGTLGATIELQSKTARAPQRSDLITKRCPVVFDPSAQCPVFLAFLDQVFGGDETLIAYVQRVFGLCLTGVPADRVMWFLYGAGRNGKSTLLNVLHDLLGPYAKKTPAETLLHKQGGDGIPNDLAELAGARMVTSAELAESRRLNESRIKDLTGRDLITARFMRRDYFTYAPSFKLFLCGNHRPVVRGTDNGIWDRLKLIPFEVRIETPDEDLPNKLRAELPGILNWALAGCLTWQRDGLQHPAKVEAATLNYRAEQDPLADFIADCCALDPSFKAPGPQLWGAYLKWCERNHERDALSRKAFSQALLDRGFTQKPTNTARLWQGIALVESDRWKVTGDRL